MTRFATILAELSDPTAESDGIRHDHSPFHLADMADCFSPDAIDSPGAVFLARIAQDVAEAIDQPADHWTVHRDHLDGLREDASALADNAVPVYTHERWQTFVDLGAYNEDVSELLPDAGDDLTRAAGVALVLIAERLVLALANELSDALDEDDDA